MIDQIKKLSNEFYQQVVAFRHHMHQFPELSFQEFDTTAFIKKELQNAGITVEKPLLETGVTALISGKNPDSKCVAIRADIDALPIQEENTLPYKSKREGLMHACGHDIHSASVFGTALILQHLNDEFEGSVKVIFQPGEEKLPGGANLLIEKGVLNQPKVQSIFGQHVFNDLPVGQVGFRSGLYMASADEFHIEIIGKGGHAALAESIQDPIEAMNHLLIRLRKIIHDNTGEIPSVIAFGDIQAKGATNVIPNTVHIKGTFRTMDEEWRAKAHELLLRETEQVADEFGVSIDLGLMKGYPFLNNEEKLTVQSMQYAKEYLGEENVIDLPLRMTSEDFAFYTHFVPGCFYRLGTSNSAFDLSSPVHTSTFYANDLCLKTGMGLMAYLVTKELK